MKYSTKRIAFVVAVSMLPSMLINAQDTTESKFSPSFHIGLLAHTYVSAQQKGFGSNLPIENATSWDAAANLYRARIMMDAKLTERDYIFMETELTASIGMGANKAAAIKILDAQYDHKFAGWLTISAGKMLVSHNRNGLQTASTLMANDFSYFQYPYNMSEERPLQNDCGRDVGINLSGGFLKNKLKYRLGAFGGRRTFEGTTSAPIRVVGRLEYNFWDIDKYSGTNLGEGKTLTLAGGVDTQGTYVAAGGDVYLDCPLFDNGSITANVAYSYLTGGNDLDAKYSFASMIPEQNIYFAELGYYIKSCKLQPWVKFERQATHDKLTSATVYGGGVNYFFNGYNTNVRLSYISMNKGVEIAPGEVKNKAYGQVWLQLQLCLF